MPQSSLDQFCFRFQNGRWEHEKSIASNEFRADTSNRCEHIAYLIDLLVKNLENRIYGEKTMLQKQSQNFH